MRYLRMVFFCTTLLFSLSTFACNIGDIIILAGTSSSGKSSIAKELIALEPSRIEDDLDIRSSPHLPRADDMQETMFDEVMGNALSGKKMLIHMDQAGTFLSRMKKKGLSIPVKSVLVYCRFHELLNRIHTRNQSSNKEDWRDPLIPFDQYANVYTVLWEDGSGLETLTLSDIKKTYNGQFDAMIEYAKKLGNSLPSEIQTEKDKVKSLKEFLERLGINDDDVSLVITPKYPKDYTLTVDNSAMDGAKGIARYIYESDF
ncbi:MAG: AAA family ATPase [Alphaproteobacteria bacterium]|nr:AAA family ATPase [Alphaproteobacteria bacterium]